MALPNSLSPGDLLSGLALAPAAEAAPTGRLLVAGDLFPGGRAEVPLGEGGADILWGELSGETARHDLCVANLECPLTDRITPILKSGPCFRANPGCARGILAGGFDTVSLANNHLMDMGEAGVVDTLSACEQAGLRTVGAGRNLEEAARPLFVSINGLRIGVLSLAEHEFSVAAEGSAGVWPLDLCDNFHQIRAVRAQADFVLVIFHGGVEYYALPTPAMVKACRFFVDAGADAVVCHHIHVPSGLEIYRKAPIIYSTGNFLFDWWPATGGQQRFSGYLVSLEVQKNAVNQLRLIPYFQTRDECRIRMMDEAAADVFLSEIAGLSAVIGDARALQREYGKLVESVRRRYLSLALSWGRFERLLYRLGMWPFWRTTPAQLARLKNNFSCESHHELIVAVLEAEMRKRKR